MRLRTGRDQSKQFIVDGAQAIRDGAFIIIAWALFVAAMLYPVLQIVGLLICALLLLRGGETDCAAGASDGDTERSSICVMWSAMAVA